jgi:hypothetical protein
MISRAKAGDLVYCTSGGDEGRTGLVKGWRGPTWVEIQWLDDDGGNPYTHYVPPAILRVISRS